MARWNLEFDKTKALNMLTYNDYYGMLREITISRFKWSDLPESLNARFIERTLFAYGRVMVFEDNTFGLMAAKCTSGGYLNFYDEPTSYQAYGTNYSGNTVPADRCVIIRNNLDEIDDDMTVRLYARKLANIDRTIDVNVNAQKTPLLITCEQSQLLTLRNVYDQYDGNKPVIYGDKKFNPDAINPLNTSAPYVADKLTMLKHDIMNEFLTRIGINNANTDKRERLITSEVDSNNDAVTSFENTALECRKLAVEKINAMFGLNITVENNKPELPNVSGGENNGEIHD